MLKCPASYWTRVLKIDQIRGVKHPSFCVAILEEYYRLTANAFMNPAVRMEHTDALGYHLGNTEPGLEREPGF